MKLSKRKKILVFLSIILFCSIFIIILNEYKNDYCGGIENGFIKDLCYLSDKNEKCYLIEDIYLQYICLRLGHRPHMLDFITTKSTTLKKDFSNILEECKDYDKYHHLFCIYTNVASLAKDNLSEAKHICNQLKDEHLIGECKFYIASSIVMNINKDTPKKINLINGICKEINNTNWRSECYYILADELAMTKPEYLEEIANACRKSNLAIDYACFDHVTQFLSIEKTIELCNFLEITNEKKDCFIGFGQIINWSNGGISAKIPVCKKLPDPFKFSCFNGLGRGINKHFSWDFNKASFACSQVPLEFREDCFDGLK